MANTDIQFKIEAEAGHKEYEGLDKSHLKRHRVVQGQVQAAHLYREDAQGKVLERLLIPRPTADPKDPLIWSTWRKHTAFIIISFFVFLSNYSTASLSPALVTVTKEFNVTSAKASYLNTFNILFLGLGNLFWVPISLKIGKRPVLILCLTIFFSSCVWNAEAKSWGSMLGARIMQGFGASVSEALGPAIVADLYFVHERGAKVGFYGIMIAGGSSLGGIFAGLVINANPNWRWIFWMDSILTGTCLLLTILFLPETNFKRPTDSETSEGSETGLVKLGDPRFNYSWRNALSIMGYYDRETSFLHYFWRPLPLLLYPAMMWCALGYGITLGWAILQLTANATYFPPLYNFSALAVGNINISNLIGAFVGCFYGGPVSDWLVAAITKRRHGYFKPEFRLWGLLLPFALGPVGLMMWGAGIGNHLHWSIPIAGSGISYGVLCAVQTIGLTYVVDSYRPVAGESMTSLTAFKNTFAFGVSFAVIPWIEKDGFTKVGGYNLLIEGIIFATTVPMYIYGERLRQWTSKFNI